MAIIHIDGNSFFASVEQACDPALRGRPVAVGRDRGLVTAVSKEAKEQGVSRGMSVWEVQKICPACMIVPSQYQLYALFSQRMFAIARRYCDDVEEYSIDEFFARVTDRSDQDTEALSWKMKKAIQRELGITVSVGVAPSKVLAKVASNWQKPDGFTSLLGKKYMPYLSKLRLDEVWGIGPQTALRLARLGVRTASHFAEQPLSWVEEFTRKPYHEIWFELHGNAVIPFGDERKITSRSIRASKTFAPRKERADIWREFSKNCERACRKLRRKETVARRGVIFLKTQQFEYIKREIPFPHKTMFPQSVLSWSYPVFLHMYQSDIEYRSTGIILCDLESQTNYSQLDMFGEQRTYDDHTSLYRTVDNLSRRFGKGSILLCSSLEKKEDATKKARRSFYIPSLGNVS